jgi:hypothetical protein
MLKQLSIARPVVTALVENQLQFMNLLLLMEFHTHRVNNTQLIMEMLNALQLISARTAHGHHAQWVKIAKINAGLLTTLSITLMPTME